MRLLEEVCCALEFSFLHGEYIQFLLEAPPQTVVQHPPAAPLWEAQVLCPLVCGDHEALGKTMFRTGIFSLTRGILTILPPNDPTDGSETLRPPPP